MITDDTIMQGDYVDYKRSYDDGIGTGWEYGAGYVISTSDEWITIQNGERVFAVPAKWVTMRAKQYRLDI